MTGMIPFNARLLVEEVSEKEQKFKSVFVPEEFKNNKKDLPKYIRVKILNVASDIKQFDWLIGQEAIVETGFYEEVRVDNKIFKFCPITYVVGVIIEEESKNEE